jgi:hypothetical protein
MWLLNYKKKYFNQETKNRKQIELTNSSGGLYKMRILRYYCFMFLVCVIGFTNIALSQTPTPNQPTQIKPTPTQMASPESDSQNYNENNEMWQKYDTITPTPTAPAVKLVMYKQWDISTTTSTSTPIFIVTGGGNTPTYTPTVCVPTSTDIDCDGTPNWLDDDTDGDGDKNDEDTDDDNDSTPDWADDTPGGPGTAPENWGSGGSSQNWCNSCATNTPTATYDPQATSTPTPKQWFISVGKHTSSHRTFAQINRMLSVGNARIKNNNGPEPIYNEPDHATYAEIIQVNINPIPTHFTVGDQYENLNTTQKIDDVFALMQSNAYNMFCVPKIAGGGWAGKAQGIPSERFIIGDFGGLGAPPTDNTLIIHEWGHCLGSSHMCETCSTPQENKWKTFIMHNNASKALRMRSVDKNNYEDN